MKKYKLKLFLTKWTGLPFIYGFNRTFTEKYFWMIFCGYREELAFEISKQMIFAIVGGISPLAEARSMFNAFGEESSYRKLLDDITKSGIVLTVK